eukprot:Lithocolla_globosa_v1_NODE_348_length_4377_cov_5.707610.p1 type:complete len:846 gc:universal NODE_348_length_4377_cov_5.707610:2769-232(-)
MPRCWIGGCSYTAADVSSVAFHVQITHENGRDLIYDCTKCLESFARLNSFQRHVARNHNDRSVNELLHERTSEDTMFWSESDEANSNSGRSDHCDHDCSDSGSGQEDKPVLTHGVNLSHHAAKFILNLKEGQVLTQTAIDSVVAGSKTLAEMYGAIIQERVLDNLSGLEEGTAENVEEMLKDPHLFALNPFKKLETEKQQKSFYKKELGFIAPTRVKLGETEVLKNGLLKKKEHLGYVVSMEESLDRRLSNSYYREDYFRKKNSTDGKIRDICDGTNFRSHPLFSQKKDAAQVMLYFDEFTVTNPVSNKVHKMGMFYTINANSSIHYRGRLDMIELIAVAKAEDIKTVPDAVSILLGDFISTMKKLGSPEGLSLQKADLTIWGALISFVGDTLAAHYIGGFKEGVGLSLRKCRCCLATSPDMSNYFFETDFQLRDLATHRDYCESLKGPHKLFWSTTYGVKNLSILDEAPYYDLTTMMPQDVSHVMLEGHYSDEMQLFLIYCVSHGLFSIDEFNTKMAAFPLLPHERADRPSPLSKKTWNHGKKICKQNASQMWMLSRMLPFLLEDLVPDDDEKWICLKAHTAILHMSMQDEYDWLAIEAINDTVYYHHSLFRLQYPQHSITPKAHYYVHIGPGILRDGPPRRYWALRFEGKHKKCKRYVIHSNWHNLPMTLATRDQLAVTDRFLKLSSELHPNVLGPRFELHGKMKKPPLEVAQLFSLNYIVNLQAVEEELFEVPQFTIFGTPFRVGTVIRRKTRPSTRDLPDYGEIRNILSFRNIYYFHVNTIEVHAFDERKLAFLATVTEEKEILPIDEFDTKTATQILHSLGEETHVHISDKNIYPRVAFN